MKCRHLMMLGCLCFGTRGTLRAQGQMPSSFAWLGGSGSVSDPSNWQNLLDFDAKPRAPGPGDGVVIAGNGDITVTGDLSVYQATIDGELGDGTAAGVTMQGSVTLQLGMAAQYATFDGTITAPGINVGPNVNFN